MPYSTSDKNGNPNYTIELSQPSETDSSLSIFGIPVSIEKDENNIVVTDYIIHMYGVGNDIQSAIEDYKISIKAYFEELEEEESNLGDNLRNQLCYLREKLKKELV